MAASLAVVADGTWEPLLSGMALAWIEYDAQPRVMIDHQLRVLWSNVAARSRLAKRQDVEVRAERLATTDPSRQDELREFILASGAAVTTWCFPCGDGDGHLLFRAQRIAWGVDTSFGVTFHASGTAWRARYADLDACFRLTRAEHQVLLDILDGHDADSLSGERGISIETARTHIRRIYDKLGVNTREALCRRAAPFRI